MVRKQVYIEESQEAFLKARSTQLGVTEAELIRRGIEQLRQSPARSPFDAKSWREVLDFLEHRGKAAVKSGPSQVSREDAYEERLSRISG